MKLSEEILLLQTNLKHVRRWKQEITEVFEEKYNSFYFSQWFLSQMRSFNDLIDKLEKEEIELYKKFNKIKSSENSPL